MTTRLIIAGVGLAGGLAALAIATRRPDIEIVLVEGSETIGGNHTWSFFDTDIGEGLQGGAGKGAGAGFRRGRPVGGCRRS